MSCDIDNLSGQTPNPDFVPSNLSRLKPGERSVAAKTYKRLMLQFTKDRPALLEDNVQRAVSGGLMSASYIWLIGAMVFGYPAAFVASFSLYLPAAILFGLAGLCLCGWIVRFIQARRSYPSLLGGVRRRPTARHPDIYT